MQPATIIKRDGRVVPFNRKYIENALYRCFDSFHHKPGIPVEVLAIEATNVISARKEQPTVEDVQDVVETILQSAGEFEAAKRYILYRNEHTKLRDVRPIPGNVKAAFKEDEKYFPSPIQLFQFYDKYSRFNYDLGRRETWVETADRSVDFLRELSFNKLDASVYQRIRDGILKMEATPSMRLLAMAGPAARRNNLAIYNCSYLSASSLESFAEALTISMSGCGVGFSVERQYVEQLPRIIRQRGKNPYKFVIPDTTEGWAAALISGIGAWVDGYDMVFDFSELRPAGAPLKIKGGRSSGPGPFKTALSAIRSVILARQGSILRPIDAHDIMCYVGNAAVSGGVRRTAMISLFDYDDAEMHKAKHGNFSQNNSQRWNANNSFVWPEITFSQADFAEKFLDMVKSGNGEPGIFNRAAANLTMPLRRKRGLMGTNPCAEIFLRDMGLCNLSIAIARKEDTYESLKGKVELATIIGTIQSMATHFPGLRDEWKKNAEEERLLGVDINGQMDSPICWDNGVKAALKKHATDVNLEYSRQLGINQSAAITCVKPSGNSSQLFDCSSGIHARWSPYYIRNIRVSVNTPIYKVLKDDGVPMSPENGQTTKDALTYVIHFPVKSPDGAITRKDRTAIQQCEFWLDSKIHWTDHNPSCTISYQSHEVIDLMKWVWEHKDVIGGLSFLPSDDAQYEQLPYQEITKDEYERLVKEFPPIDFSKIYRYEEEDLTTAAQEQACVSGLCEVDFNIPREKNDSQYSGN